MNDYISLGQPSFINVTAAMVDLANRPFPEGAVMLRDVSSQAIYQVINGAKVHVTASDYSALGSPTRIDTTANLIATAAATVPQGTTYLRHPVSGDIFQITAGTKRLLSWAEFSALGTPAYVNAAPTWFTSIPSIGE